MLPIGGRHKNMRTRHACVHAVLLASAVLSGRLAPAQPASDAASVWDGVYTDAQAARGQAAFEAYCLSCHVSGPRTAGPFMRDWGGTVVEALFTQVRRSMPPGNPGSLDDETYLDLVAYQLQANAFPAGRRELDAGALARIRIEDRDGTAPVLNFSLIRVVGCLRRADPAAGWRLADAGDPARTKNPAVSIDDELQEAHAAALGAHAFGLMNIYPAPDPYDGHKVEAKGFLIRDPAGDWINVTSVQTLAARCEP
jgi:mono/diheme cytochrome c family protein